MVDGGALFGASGFGTSANCCPGSRVPLHLRHRTSQCSIARYNCDWAYRRRGAFSEPRSAANLKASTQGGQQ